MQQTKTAGREASMITVSYLSLSGSEVGQAPKWPVLKRAQCAHEARIHEIGIRLDTDLDPRIRQYVRTPEIEWVELSQTLTLAVANQLRTAAHEYGANRVNCGVASPGTSWEDITHNLEALAMLADTLKMRVCFEPVVFGPIATMRAVQNIIKAAGNPHNVGQLYDMWQVDYAHYAYGVTAPEDCRIAEVQLAGTRAHYDRSQPRREAMRRPSLTASTTGHGGLLRLTDHARWSFWRHSYVSYEVTNPYRRSLGCQSLAYEVAGDIIDNSIMDVVL